MAHPGKGNPEALAMPGRILGSCVCGGRRGGKGARNSDSIGRRKAVGGRGGGEGKEPGAITRHRLSTLPAGDLLRPTAAASPSGSRSGGGRRRLECGCGGAGGRGGGGGGGVSGAGAGSRDSHCSTCRGWGSRCSATTGGHRSLRHYCLPHTAMAPPELPGAHPSGRPAGQEGGANGEGRGRSEGAWFNYLFGALRKASGPPGKGWA